MQYAFDLDGTLAHTRDAVLAAYRAVGVEPPEDFFGKTWREWLHDPVKHHQKNEVYLKMMNKVQPTSIVDLFEQVGGIIVTGASAAAAYAVLQRLDMAREPERVFTELNTKQKAECLNGRGFGIVFEDSPDVAKYLKENTSWTTCLVL